MKIGILDSGVGGLTVATEIIKKAPDVSINYFADAANCPYGDKSPKEIYELAENALRFFENKNPSVIVIACGTISSVALIKLQEKSKIPLLGVISSKYKPKAVLATSATCSSGIFSEAIAIACPLFVPMIEAGQGKAADFKALAKEYLRQIPKDINEILLGCTHYPLVLETLLEVRPAKYINMADALIKELLTRFPDFKSKRGANGEHEFYTSGEPSRFDFLAKSMSGLVCSSKKA